MKLISTARSRMKGNSARRATPGSSFEELVAGRIGLRGGFTLAETLIVIAVMAVISAILLGASKVNSVQIALSTDQATLAGALNRAKSLAIARFAGTADPSKLPCGFGVHFDALKNAVVIYGDSRVAGKVCDGPGSQDHGYLSGEDIQSISLDSRVQFDGSPPDVVFLSPYLKTFGAGTITLRVKNGTQAASVQVTAGGSITSL